jgi:hypothetical protein
MVSGVGQLLLAVAGFGMVVAWFITVFIQFYSLVNIKSDVQPRSMGWLGLAGFGVFALAWLWALVTSFSLLREGRQNAAAGFEQPTPRRMDST